MDPAEICASDLTQQVMVIQLPRGDRAESDLSAYRDYVVESLSQGVLVLGSGTTWAVETVPSLGGVQIQRDAGVLRAHSVPVTTAAPSTRPDPWREKKEALARLQEYRQAGGLGCLEAVASRCGGDLTADTLRGVLTGAEKLPIEQWRIIRRALDQLEEGRDE
nr:MAG TPA: hypothetical protein [Caudoviricetes sp.]